MSLNVYALALEQARNDLSWIDREIERLNTQQKVLADLVNCLKHFVPDGHASTHEHGGECAGVSAAADSEVSHGTEHEAHEVAIHEAAEPLAEQLM